MRKKLTFVMVLLFGILVTVTGAGKKTFTLVIDAGHGGHDAGAVGAISKEKNINPLMYVLAVLFVLKYFLL